MSETDQTPDQIAAEIMDPYKRELGMTAYVALVLTIGEALTAERTARIAAEQVDEGNAAMTYQTKCRMCEKFQPCPEHGRTPASESDFAELSSDVAGWQLCEELRPQIPAPVFTLLCRASGPPGSFGRKWMLMQPFRWLLFRKIARP